MKRIIILLFILMALAQWLVPGEMLWSVMQVAKKGKAYKFQTAPVDPEHPFQGRYVRLDFAANQYQVKANHGLNTGQDVYLTFEEDSAGFARIKTMYRQAPRIRNFVKAQVQYINNYDDGPAMIFLDLPFSEYYTEEFKAPAIEKLYGDTATRRDQTYALVKIYKGQASIQTLYINNKSVDSLNW